MKKIAILSLTFIFAALLTVSPLAQNTSTTSFAVKSNAVNTEDSPLLSNWEVIIAAPGQDLPGTLKLEKDGENFKGSLTTELGEAPFKNVKVKDDKTFTADITVNAQGQTMEGTISGKLAEEKLSGEITLPGLGAIPYAGKKAEKK
jgi:hypothetical protein